MFHLPSTYRCSLNFTTAIVLKIDQVNQTEIQGQGQKMGNALVITTGAYACQVLSI